MPMIEVIVDHLAGAEVFFSLDFFKGTFSGAAQRWAIVEKEAFSIVECLKLTDYLLHTPGGFALFTDHAKKNLKFIFNPALVNAAIPKYTAAKLDRWAFLLMGYTYTIYDIAGEMSVGKWHCRKCHENGPEDAPNVALGMVDATGSMGLIVAVVMLILNQSPSDTLGGVAPITVMTGARAMSPLELICVDGPIQSTLEDLWSVRCDELKAIVKVLDNIHEQVAMKSAKKRAQNRDRRATKWGTSMAQFDLGDFVLYLDVWSMTYSKLSVTWRGLAQGVRVILEWIYEIQI
ncbi:hypothetical protein H310_15065 [Aphanomyces invadans]|uniref:Reverse transcriptase RNase H-like domain-containing protein n=1 Tax=Aphanomyces invadans TaxID=157072 RepID=A0A024T8Z5_9STRA|nr:hypothetical protein H310_15065 [Aphanomyces invadans]ETV90101.1 hypothetical protein H310_15065 [Aphanomyces invadans]|eukprot:XP_008881265.1 hypothetical protein H310_15065 [Aphanomyces invadans]